MPESPDYSGAADVFRKTMEEALANIDQVNANLKLEQEKAIDLQIAARDEYNRILNEADKTAEARIEERRKANLEQIRHEVWTETIEKLIVAEIPSDMLKRILHLPAKILADVWFKLGFDKLDENHIAHVGYENEGRSGYVIFYRNDLTARFYYEFGGGDTVAIITIPSPERWEAETRIPLPERQVILEFIAKRVIRDQAAGCIYFIGENEILIQQGPA
ncbi:MAG TPA: hypothetical protein VLA46_11760 [Saprospiraceae bacterium]|nr:hypothetical protein [Saprospiraceae bacterium]